MPESINPIEGVEQDQLPEIKVEMTAEQILVNDLAIEVLNHDQETKGESLSDRELTVPSSLDEEVEATAEEEEMPVEESMGESKPLTKQRPITGEKYQLSPPTVAKLINFFETVSIHKLEEAAQEKVSITKEAAKKEAVKREQDSERVRKEEIKQSIEKRRAVLRSLRAYLRNEDMKDHRSFLETLEEYSDQEREELEAAFQEMREDWRLFEGMKNLYEGRVEKDLLGINIQDSASQDQSAA